MLSHKRHYSMSKPSQVGRRDDELYCIFVVDWTWNHDLFWFIVHVSSLWYVRVCNDRPVVAFANSSKIYPSVAGLTLGVLSVISDLNLEKICSQNVLKFIALRAKQGLSLAV